MTELTSSFKQFAREQRADLIGIAPVERFEGIPPNHHPCSIFPETRSVIVIGKRITRGTLRGLEEGTQFDIYGQYGMRWLADRMLAITTIALATWIEDHRWEAVPLQDLPTQVPPSGVPVAPNLPAPNVMVDAKDAAVRSGLGEIGYSGELLTPQFGPRQRIQMILTDAVMDASPLCETPVCTGCKQCARTCPLDAIPEDGGEIVEVCGKTMEVADVTYDLCRTCQNGALGNPNHPAGLPDRLGALCVRSCVQSLEQASRVENTFGSPFRKRSPWQKDVIGRTSLQEVS
jgi:epoxyqueuosine reductase QueG